MGRPQGNLRQLLLEAQEDSEGLPVCWNCGYPPGRSPQGQARGGPEAAGDWSAPVTGPFKLNGTPLRRVNQRFLLATATKIDVSGVKVPDNINDKYFARIKAEKGAKKDGEIFDAKKEEY